MINFNLRCIKIDSLCRLVFISLFVMLFGVIDGFIVCDEGKFWRDGKFFCSLYYCKWIGFWFEFMVFYICWWDWVFILFRWLLILIGIKDYKFCLLYVKFIYIFRFSLLWWYGFYLV